MARKPKAEVQKQAPEAVEPVVEPAIEQASVKKQKRITRVETVALAIKEIDGEATVERILEAADKIAAGNGLSVNRRESKFYLNPTLQALTVFGLIQVYGDVVKRV